MLSFNTSIQNIPRKPGSAIRQNKEILKYEQLKNTSICLYCQQNRPHIEDFHQKISGFINIFLNIAE